MFRRSVSTGVTVSEKHHVGERGYGQSTANGYISRCADRSCSDAKGKATYGIEARLINPNSDMILPWVILIGMELQQRSHGR